MYKGSTDTDIIINTDVCNYIYQYQSMHIIIATFRLIRKGPSLYELQWNLLIRTLENADTCHSV